MAPNRAEKFHLTVPQGRAEQNLQAEPAAQQFHEAGQAGRCHGGQIARTASQNVYQPATERYN